MKEKIILTILNCFIVLSLFAQNQITPHYKGGSEIGLSIGRFWIDGDVESELNKGYTAGIHWRKGVNNVWSIKVGLSHGKAYGLDYMPTDNLFKKYPNVFSGYDNDNAYFFAYRTNYSSIEISNIFELTNLAPDVFLKKWNVYVGFGIGFANFTTGLNLLDENENVYTQLITRTGYNIDNEVNTVEGRKAIRSKLREIYDNSYETPGPKKIGKFRLGDETNIQAHFLLNVGLARKITNRINLGFEYSARFSDNDLLDGYDKIVDVGSSGKDIVNAFNLVLGYNLSRSHNKKPLYWRNAWSAYDEKLDETNAAIDSLTMDDDLDGVFNNVDQQANSMPNCPVDQFGVTLDSDKDGIPDCIDPNPFMNEKDLNKLLKDWSSRNGQNSHINLDSLLTLNSSALSLEDVQKQMIISQLNRPVYFDFNQASLSVDAKKHLLEVSKAMHRFENLQLTLKGFASSPGLENVNQELSKLRAFTVKQFLVDILNVKNASISIEFYGEKNLAVIANQNENEFLNRRVELVLF